MPHIDFPTSTIGRDFACGLSNEPIQHQEVFGQITNSACRACPHHHTLCTPVLPKTILHDRVVAIQNDAGHFNGGLPTDCTLIQGGTLCLPDGDWHPSKTRKLT